MSAVRSSRRASAGPRIGRRFLALLAVACVAGISATAALAWSQYYEQNTSFSAGDLRTSAYNSGVDQNKVNFSNIFGGLPQMGTRLISGGGSPYTWTWSNTGSIEDYRSISYGAAQCMANSGSGYAVYVSLCWAANF